MTGSLGRPLAAAVALILSLPSWTGPGAAAQQAPQFSTAVRQVEVYATVTDADGRPVRDLGQAAFTVLEDGRPQPIRTFIAGEFPVAVALAVDRSVSMAGTPLTMARTAARVFLAGLRPDDRAMLIGISGKVEVLSPLSTDRQPMLDALARLDPWSTTSLHDAIIRSVDLLDGDTGRRAVIVLSDGTDRYSDASAADVLARVQRADVLVYPIALGDRRPPLFAEIAAASGGRSFHLRRAEALVKTLETIGEDLRSQYLLGYEPLRPWADTEAEWRAIEVRVGQPELRVRARSGYTTR